MDLYDYEIYSSDSVIELILPFYLLVNLWRCSLLYRLPSEPDPDLFSFKMNRIRRPKRVGVLEGIRMCYMFVSSIDGSVKV